MSLVSCTIFRSFPADFQPANRPIGKKKRASYSLTKKP
jgi:hypothetical protein